MRGARGTGTPGGRGRSDITGIGVWGVLPLLIQGARVGGGENMLAHCPPPLGLARGSTGYCHGPSGAQPPNSYVEPSAQHLRVGQYLEMEPQEVIKVNAVIRAGPNPV